MLGFRGYQLYDAVKGQEGRRAAALSGEIVLRLIAVGGSAAKLVPVFKNVKVESPTPAKMAVAADRVERTASAGALPDKLERVASASALAEELQAFRRTLPERTARSGGTAGVARTDLPGLESRTFRGVSPRAGGPMEPGGTIISPNRSPQFRLHAEQDLANQIDRAIQEAGLTPQQMAGKTVNMRIEERVCNICRQGLRGTDVPPGVLKQLSDKYPNLTFNVTNSATDEVLRFRAGRFVD